MVANFTYGFVAPYSCAGVSLMGAMAEFSPPEAFLYGRKGTPLLSRHVDCKFFYKKMDAENKYFFSPV